MRTAVYHPPREIHVEERPIPKIRDGEILLKVRACGLCGTDVLKVTRALPKNPVILGHELVGDVIEISKGVERFKKGDRVVVAHHVPCGECHYCRHGNHSMCRHFKESNLDPGGFAEYLRVPAEHVQQTAFLVPKNLSDDEALFTEPLACCVRNVRRASLLSGDFTVVVGMGSIGLMMVQLLKLVPTKVLALDLFDERLELAKKLGADFTMRGDSAEIAKFILEKTEGRKADLVVFTAGGGKVFQTAFDWVRDGGALNLFASLSDRPVEVSLDALYHHEINVFSSYSPSPQDLAESHRLLCAGKVKVEKLITHHVGLEGLREAVDLVVQQKAMKVIVNP
jgi:L-iditol 2-dehydrogenase